MAAGLLLYRIILSDFYGELYEKYKKHDLSSSCCIEIEGRVEGGTIFKGREKCRQVKENPALVISKLLVFLKT